jgi:hypothetical protein
MDHKLKRILTGSSFRASRQYYPEAKATMTMAAAVFD